jgi:hypothetical protein
VAEQTENSSTAQSQFMPEKEILTIYTNVHAVDRISVLGGVGAGRDPPQLRDADGSLSSQSPEPGSTIVGPLDSVHWQVTDLFCFPSQVAEQSVHGPKTHVQSEERIVYYMHILSSKFILLYLVIALGMARYSFALLVACLRFHRLPALTKP